MRAVPGAGLERLRDASWMKTLPPSLQERVLLDVYETSHAPDDVIAARDEWPHTWMGITEGFVKIMTTLKDGRVVQFAGIPEGGWIGAAALILTERRRHDVVAVKRTRVAHVPQEVFGALLRSSPEFNQFILAGLSRRVLQLMSMVESTRVGHPTARLAQAIVGVFDAVLPDSASLELRLSQEELGELAGLTRQRTNLALKALERGGLVVVLHGGLFVRDLGALRQLAEGAQ